MVVEEQNVIVNQSNKIQTLKKLVEEAKAKKIAAKQKAIEWEEKFDRASKSVHKWANKYEKLWLANTTTI